MKNFAKKGARGLAHLLVFPLVLSYRIETCFFEEREGFRVYSELLSLFPGLWGMYLRRAFYQGTLEHCSEDSYIGFGTVLSTPKVSIGDRVYIGAHCSLGSVRIGADSMLASGVRIVSGLHQHGTRSLETPMREQEGVFKTIEIGEDCWLGEGSIVAAALGDKCIVSLGSVVTTDAESYSVLQGNPAKVLRKRKACA